MSGTIIVTGAGGPAGASLCRQLLARGFEVVGVDLSPFELYGVSSHRVPAAADPAFVEALSRLADLERADLVIPTVTEELVVLAGCSMLGCAHPAAVVVGSAAAVRLANDKLLTCRHLQSVGVPVPRFALPSELRQGRIGAALGDPYLSKPRVSRGGRAVATHTRGHEPADALPAGGDDSILLQEFIPGVEYAPNLYLAADPAHDVVVVLEKTALAHGNVGNALSTRRVGGDEDRDVADLARDAARALGLRGPADVDVRRRADGAPVVLEINARFGANSAQAPEVLDALLGEYGAGLDHVVAATAVSGPAGDGGRR